MLSLDVNYFSTINLMNLDIILIISPLLMVRCAAITVLFCLFHCSIAEHLMSPILTPHDNADISTAAAFAFASMNE